MHSSKNRPQTLVSISLRLFLYVVLKASLSANSQSNALYARFQSEANRRYLPSASEAGMIIKCTLFKSKSAGISEVISIDRSSTEASNVTDVVIKVYLWLSPATCIEFDLVFRLQECCGYDASVLLCSCFV